MAVPTSGGGNLRAVFQSRYRKGSAMTTTAAIVKYLAVRTAAFVSLTAATVAVMALPYLG
jgi:hypothetical protein